MKAIYTAIITASVAIQAAEANESYVNFIVQTDNPVFGETADTATTSLPTTFPDIDSSGEMLAAPVGPEGSTFELFTINTETNEETLVAETAAGVFIPTATIEIISKDPSTAQKRTRADWEFRAAYSIDGLVIGDPDAPEGAKSVVLQHSATPSVGGTTIIETTSLDKNGDGTTEDEVTVIPDASISTDGAEETFTIFTSVPLIGGDPSQLDSKSIKIFPKATASISGFSEVELYNRFPAIDLVYTDLYPSSGTWLRFQPVNVVDENGDQVTEPIDLITEGVTFKSVSPADTELGDAEFLTVDINEFVPLAGEYRVEVVHHIKSEETGFDNGEEVLDSKTIHKKATIKINANVGGSE